MRTKKDDLYNLCKKLAQLSDSGIFELSVELVSKKLKCHNGYASSMKTALTREQRIVLVEEGVKARPAKYRLGNGLGTPAGPARPARPLAKPESRVVVSDDDIQRVDLVAPWGEGGAL